MADEEEQEANYLLDMYRMIHPERKYRKIYTLFGICIEYYSERANDWLTLNIIRIIK